MKFVLTIAAAFVFAAPAFAQPAGEMKSMPAMAGADHASMTMADGAGVVTAVDTKAGTVTIHHGPIAKLSWPAMTMAFKASSPSLLNGLKGGQSVTFTLMRMGGSTTLTAIKSK